jgi:Tfp pilus assembly protein PilF
MSAINRLKRAVNESSHLSKRGEHLKALKVLDDAIAEAVKENRPVWICVLSRHASVLADQMGDLALVRAYSEQCLRHDPDNPLALLGLADVLHRQGEHGLARQYALKSYRISSQRDTELDRAVVESLLKTWPDLQNGIA